MKRHSLNFLTAASLVLFVALMEQAAVD